MAKGLGVYSQIFLLGGALLAWNLQPAYKQFMLAASNLQTEIATPKWYYAGDANTSCEVLEPDVLQRCEDGVFVSDKKILLTCDPGRLKWNPIVGVRIDPKPQGSLRIIDYKNGDYKSKSVELVGLPKGKGFHPLGVEIWPASATSEAVVFVANLDVDASVVDVFTLSNSAPYKAKYVRTVQHKNLHSPNSIVATSATSFYASNDHRWSVRMHPWLAKLTFLENFLQFPTSWVAHIELLPNDQVKYTTAANWINFANGVAISADGKEFVVASSITSIIMFYDRDPKTNKLTYREFVPAPFPPDNLRYDANGDLLFAGNPHIPQLFEVAYGVRAYSPSWMAALRKRKPVPEGTVLPADDLKAPFVKSSDRVPQHPKYEIETLYYGDGSQFTSSATCLRDGTEIFGTTLLGVGILHCKA